MNILYFEARDIQQADRFGTEAGFLFRCEDIAKPPQTPKSPSSQRATVPLQLELGPGLLRGDSSHPLWRMSQKKSFQKLWFILKS
jgi:hypothetical protein